ncbi:MAG: alpha/beta hydrolase, partial [Nanoarchaeota archaeon]|nr:alpha/beta hydrolase [Nanoarchaeota archaeon]
MSTKTLEGVLKNTNEYKTRFQDYKGEIISKYIDLPLTKLHYTKCGSGPQLIMVPATMSYIKNWIPLIQFMGQKFTTYFFELPGYGGSTPYKENFSSELVTKTIESFADKLKIDNFSIMGFSFGGILALKAVDYLEDRINKVILLSPCVSKKAMNFSTLRSIIARGLAYSLKNNLFRKLISSKKFGTPFLSYLRKFGKIDIPIEEHLKKMPEHTLKVLVQEINEVLNFEIKR